MEMSFLLFIKNSGLLVMGAEFIAVLTSISQYCFLAGEWDREKCNPGGPARDGKVMGISVLLP